MKSRCPSLLRSCRVFWASCIRFRFWFNWSVWLWRDEMRTEVAVSTCCMNPASSTSRQRRSSPNSFLTTHFSTSDSFWLDREQQRRSSPPIDWELKEKQTLYLNAEWTEISNILRETLVNKQTPFWGPHDVQQTVWLVDQDTPEHTAITHSETWKNHMNLTVWLTVNLYYSLWCNAPTRS